METFYFILIITVSSMVGIRKSKPSKNLYLLPDDDGVAH